MIVKLVGSSEEKNKVKWIFFFIATILIIVFGSPLFYDSILDDGLDIVNRVSVSKRMLEVIFGLKPGILFNQLQ